MTEDDEVTAPLASQEVALCGSEIHASPEDKVGALTASPSRHKLLQTMINYVRQFPKAFKRQA